MPVHGDTLRTLAIHVANLLNCQTFPVTGKTPAGGHHWLPDEQSATAGIQSATDVVWHNATGYGIVALPGSDLYIIDCDSLVFLSRLLREFPMLLQETSLTYSGDNAVGGHCQVFIRLTLPRLPDGPLSVVEGGHEIGSLRGHRSYGIGPGSLHPTSGRPYRSNAISIPKLLDAEQSARLLALFDRPRPQARLLHRATSRPDDIARVAAILRRRGYKENGVWLNGSCLWPEHHKHGDAHPSAGFNTDSGVWHCFACGDFSLGQVMAVLGLSAPQQPSPGRSHTFVGELEASDDDVVEIEVNLAVELFRRGQYQSARFFEVLRDYSREHGGVRTFRTRDLIALGAGYRLSAADVKNALRQLTQVGLLNRPRRGLYVRVGVVEAQRLLGLGDEYAAAPLPHSALLGSPSDYCRAVVAAVEAYLPIGHSSQTISQAAGRSRRSLYRYENALGIVREPQVRRTGIATAPGPSFVVVSGSDGQRVAVLDGEDVQGACEIAVRSGGIPWAFAQKPSVRRFPEEESHSIKFGTRFT